MPWTVLYGPILLQQQEGDSGYINTVAVFAVPFMDNGQPVADNNGDAIMITGQTPLLATYQQPSDFWSLLAADIDSQLSKYSGYDNPVYYRVDLPST